MCIKAEFVKIKIKDLVNGYENNDEYGVLGYGGNLNIRPPYQRNFIYDAPEQGAVISSIMNNLPISIFYWVDNKDGTYELLDGQQRTMSICEYFDGNKCDETIPNHITSGKYQFRFYHNLEKEEQEQFLNYELMVFICDGNDIDKLEWFKTINKSTKVLFPQELRNAIYTGEWLTDAKKYFSKTGCLAHNLGSEYLSGKLNRQEYLQTVLEWASHKEGIDNIELYMAKKQKDKNAKELETYFRDIIKWVKRVFPKHRKEMKGLDWGIWYNQFGNNGFNPIEMEKEIKRLMMDDEVTKKNGIYEYLLTKNERKLNLRGFSENIKRQVFESQNGVCVDCGQKFDDYNEMQADHITPWSEGGTTTKDNCQLLCKKCNRTKSNM